MHKLQITVINGIILPNFELDLHVLKFESSQIVRYIHDARCESSFLSYQLPITNNR